MDMLLLRVVLIVLVSEVLGVEKDKDQIEEKCRSSPPYKEVLSLNPKKDVNLTCIRATWTQKQIFYVIWHICLTDKVCKMNRNSMGHYENTCLDNMALRNNTEGQPILHITNFSHSNVGNYTCEAVYNGGVGLLNYDIKITAPPKISSWTESSRNKILAVCRAERANPAATISWAFTGKITMKTVNESNTFFTVTSSVELNTTEEAQNMSCTITHPLWDKARVLVPSNNKSQIINVEQKHNAIFLGLTIGFCGLFCLALLIWGIKDVRHIRLNHRSSKSPRVDYVEEVEPYACYVQRVNTIYNSRRDLVV